MAELKSYTFSRNHWYIKSEVDAFINELKSKDATLIDELKSKIANLVAERNEFLNLANKVKNSGILTTKFEKFSEFVETIENAGYIIVKCNKKICINWLYDFGYTCTCLQLKFSQECNLQNYVVLCTESVDNELLNDCELAFELDLDRKQIKIIKSKDTRYPADLMISFNLMDSISIVSENLSPENEASEICFSHDLLDSKDGNNN